MKRKAEGQLDLLTLEVPQAAQATVVATGSPAQIAQHAQQLVRKRDGSTEVFSRTRIALAIESAFKAVRDIPADEPMTGAMAETVTDLAEKIAKRLLAESPQQLPLEVEQIQDAVENQLMLDGFLTEARRYILYREDRRKLREQKAESTQTAPSPRPVRIIRHDGRHEQFDPERIRRRLTEATHGLEGCDVNTLVREISEFVSDGTTTTQICRVLLTAIKSRRGENASYDKVAARLVLKQLYSEAIPSVCAPGDFPTLHQNQFREAIETAVEAGELASELLMFDLLRLSTALKIERDELIACDGLQWLYDNCLARHADSCIETPQFFWMRIAMALAINETEKENRAIEFYDVLSSLRFVPSERLLRTSGRAPVILSRFAEDAEEQELTSRPVGHLNLCSLMRGDILDELLLYGTINSAVRLLDNAIDLTPYEVMREHRDIGIGIVGYDAARPTAERCTESVAFYATLASTTLASQRGMHPSHSDSNWDIDILPFESLKSLHAERIGSIDGNGSKDWVAVRSAVRRHGMRNSHLMALTPANVAEKFIRCSGVSSSFATELDQLVRCRKWVDGPVYITLPEYLSGPDLEQACVLAQQLGIRPFMPATKPASDSNAFTDAAAATKVLKSIEK